MEKSNWSEPMGGCDSEGNPITVSFGSGPAEGGRSGSAMVTVAVAWVSAAGSPTVRRTTYSLRVATTTTTDPATDRTTTVPRAASTPAPVTDPIVLDMT